MEYDNIEVHVFQGNLHAKGYIFDKGETSMVIVGSSNMTQTALTCNKEWNVLYQTVENSRPLGKLRGEFNSLWNDTSTVALSQEWIGLTLHTDRRVLQSPNRNQRSRQSQIQSRADIKKSSPIKCSSALSKHWGNPTQR